MKVEILANGLPATGFARPAEIYETRGPVASSGEPYFGPTEIEEATTADIEDLFLTCQSFQPPGVFDHALVLKIGLNLAYCLLDIVRKDEDAFKKLRQLMRSAPRRRAPRRANTALLAVLFVLKPADEAQRKLCSDYATILIWAIEENVKSEDFETAFARTTIRACKRYVRNKRQEAKGATPQNRVNQSWLEISVGDEQGMAGHLKAPIDRDIYAEIVPALSVASSGSSTECHAALAAIARILSSGLTGRSAVSSSAGGD